MLCVIVRHMETTIPVFFFKFLFKIYFWNESFDLTHSFIFINLTCWVILSDIFVSVERLTEILWVQETYLSNLRHSLARFPVDFLPCKLFMGRM